jgi:hypothetical protein
MYDMLAKSNHVYYNEYKTSMEADLVLLIEDRGDGQLDVEGRENANAC